MEGDVDGVMDRPTGQGEEAHRAREKWDAWKQQQGLSRTEAKRRYISTLIDTMHKYASPSPDARELVAELEFVWDQVKSNVSSDSSSSSPLQRLSIPGLHNPPTYPTLGSSQASGDFRNQQPVSTNTPMREVSPESEDQDAEEEEAEEREEFVDAPDSQYELEHLDNRQEQRRQETQPSAPTNRPSNTRRRSSPNSEESKWRRRVEQALVKMTAEVAALREQLESRRLLSHSRRHSLLGWARWVFWNAARVVMVDVFVLGVVLLWMRRKKDRRLEGAIRVLLGDAVAEMQRVGGKQISKLQLPKLPSIKS
ncbi:hypothetical protein H2201_004473 [Coniosporium apollinis]|uniref:ACB domain-containing protein n=1 Tax=Coniosporium apollinis TaxID=61459 RepID=A0ABQ9NUS8_9PEZI|nr:hypothetical protein H2201_004473 [Coniosporium apollinis]